MTAAPLVLIANAADATISAFRLAGRSLQRVGLTELPGHSSTFAVDERAGLVYVGCKGDRPLVVTYRLDTDAGTLTELCRTEVDADMTYLSVAHEGRVLLGAAYSEGVGHAWPLTNGRLGAIASSVYFANLHCVVTAGDGTHAYFVSLGDDLVAQYRLSDAGRLSPLTPETVPAPRDSGPRHLTLSADEANAYLVTEYSGEVIRLARDADGVLTPAESVSIVDPAAGLRHSRINADPTAEHLIWGADVHVAGDYVIASERSASTLASVRLEDGGRLGEVVALRTTEAFPRGFNVTRDGRHVVAVGERSPMVSLYEVRPDGSLEQLDRVETGGGPNWVRIIEA